MICGSLDTLLMSWFPHSCASRVGQTEVQTALAPTQSGQAAQTPTAMTTTTRGTASGLEPAPTPAL